ncbi:Uncharacterized protein Fot_24669 [Forsythia ovata]|uniref:Uncharacterized protein n=1 Tax=Forsythia ovata TaxID=205694 RepID=A0ABD1U6X9_9LAMI
MINFNKSKKNPSSGVKVLQKTVQTKLLVKTKTPPPTKGVVIKEPTSQLERATSSQLKGKEKANAMIRQRHRLLLHPLLNQEVRNLHQVTNVVGWRVLTIVLERDRNLRLRSPLL